MTSRYVGDFMRHDSGQFGLILGFQNQTLVDIEITAGQCKSVDFVSIDHFDDEGDFGV